MLGNTYSFLKVFQFFLMSKFNSRYINLSYFIINDIYWNYNLNVMFIFWFLNNDVIFYEASYTDKLLELSLHYSIVITLRFRTTMPYLEKKVCSFVRYQCILNWFHIFKFPKLPKSDTKFSRFNYLERNMYWCFIFLTSNNILGLEKSIS